MSTESTVSEHAYLATLQRWQLLVDKVMEHLADGDPLALLDFAAVQAGECDYWDNELDDQYVAAVSRWRLLNASGLMIHE